MRRQTAKQKTRRKKRDVKMTQTEQQDAHQLLGLMEDEGPEREQLIVAPPGFDPVKKIAAVLKKSKPRKDLLAIDAGSLDQRLAAAYIVENLDQTTVNTYLGRGRERKKGPDKSLQMLAVLDAAQEFRGRAADKAKTIEEMAVKAATNVYMNVFATLCDIVYNPKAKGGAKNAELQLRGEIEEQYRTPFHQYRPASATGLAAARKIAPLVETVQPGLVLANSASDLKYLAAIGAYSGMLKNKELAEDIMKKLVDKGKELRDIYIYAALKIHEDFFKEMEKL